MYVHARSAAVNVLAAAGALQDLQYQLAPGPAQDVTVEALIKSDPVENMRLFDRAVYFAPAGGALGSAAC